MSGALPPVPVLIEANAAKSLRQALELVVPQGVGIVEIPPYATANIRRLWCAPEPERSPTTHDCPEPERFATVLREIARRIDPAVGPAAGPEKIFLARSPGFARKLVNREAIEAVAQARGFVIAFPESLDFAEQYRLTRNARFLIGPDGSAMYLALFAKPGAKVCFLSSREALVMMPGRTAPFIPLGVDVSVFAGGSVNTACTRTRVRLALQACVITAHTLPTRMNCARSTKRWRRSRSLRQNCRGITGARPSGCAGGRTPLRPSRCGSRC